MKKPIDTLIQLSVATMLVLNMTQVSAASAAKNAQKNMEKCYGISKAGMNDCAAGKASCAGSATKDSQGDAFVFLPKGLCERIVGGSLKEKS